MYIYAIIYVAVVRRVDGKGNKPRTTEEYLPMGKRLLILGAGAYSLVAKEIALAMDCFEKIAFIDDHASIAPDGSAVIGKISELKAISADFTHAIVAIGNPDFRMKLIGEIERETACNVATLLSPCAYVAPSAELAEGCIIEPMAVVHSKCILGKGCLLSAGAVVNHYSELGEGVHVDCNGVVSGYQKVPSGKKIEAGAVFAEQIKG